MLMQGAMWGELRSTSTVFASQSLWDIGGTTMGGAFLPHTPLNC